MAFSHSASSLLQQAQRVPVNIVFHDLPIHKLKNSSTQRRISALFSSVGLALDLCHCFLSTRHLKDSDAVVTLLARYFLTASHTSHFTVVHRSMRNSCFGCNSMVCSNEAPPVLIRTDTTRHLRFRSDGNKRTCIVSIRPGR